MHAHNLDQWAHSHRFHLDSVRGEKNTYRVIILTLVMMVVEIGAGYLFGLTGRLRLPFWA